MGTSFDENICIIIDVEVACVLDATKYFVDHKGSHVQMWSNILLTPFCEIILHGL